MAGSASPRSARNAACSSPASCATSASMMADTQPRRVPGRPARSPRAKLSVSAAPRAISFSARLRHWRIGFWERNVNPRIALASSSPSARARRGVSASNAALHVRRITCSRPSAGARRVHDGDGRVVRLPGFEEEAEPIHALVGHSGHADVHLAARGPEGRRRHALPGEQVEERRLPALGKSHDPDLHRLPVAGGAGAVLYPGGVLMPAAARYILLAAGALLRLPRPDGGDGASKRG